MTSVPAGDHPPPEEVEAAVIAGRSQRGAGPHPGLGPVAQHVDGCEDCAALAASMLAVQRLLRAEGRRPAPPLPDHLGARLDAALARAAAERSAVALPVDLASRRPPRARRAVPRWVALAAGVAVLGGAALTATRLLPERQTAAVEAGARSADDAGALESAESDAGAELDAADPKALASGTDYRPDLLADQVAELLMASVVHSPQGADAHAGGSPPAPDTLPQSGDTAGTAGGEPLADPAAVQRCLRAIGAGNEVPLAVDLARWRGEDAAVLVLPAESGDRIEVWVVPRDCGPGRDALLSYEVVDR